MALSIKTDDATQEQYQNMFLEAKELDPTLTQGKFFADMVRKLQESNPEPGPVDLSNYILKETHEEIHENYTRYHNILFAINQTLATDDQQFELEEIPEMIRKIQQRAMMVPAVEYLPEPMQENEIRFEIPEPHLSLLNETKKRLSEKYGTTITMKDILLDMFARYTIERYNEWFYPFVISPDEFESITGYNHTQLKAWLRKK